MLVADAPGFNASFRIDMVGKRCHDAAMQRLPHTIQPLAATLFVLSTSFLACELPQNAPDPGDTISSEDTEELVLEPRSWRLLKIVDRSLMDETEMPGLDVDAIVVSLDGEFISAGCKSVPVLYEDEEQGSSNANMHANPQESTLHAVDGDGPGGGFLSMAGGVLTCELPVAIWTGSTITIRDVESDGLEPWDAQLASDASSDFEDAALDLSGSSEFLAP